MPYLIECADLTTRTESWFRAMAPGIAPAADVPDTLVPAWARADMVARALDGRVKLVWLMDPGSHVR